MKRFPVLSKFLPPALALLLLIPMAVPATAFPWSKKDSGTQSNTITKNVMVGETLSFSPEALSPAGQVADLTAITINTLPDAGAGLLTIGGQPLSTGSVVDGSALSGLKFQALASPTVTETAFSFTPSLSSGNGTETTVKLVLLTQANQAPIARNMELSTYKDVSLTSWFDAVDSEGDVLTFQLTSTPARGAVSMAEDGSSQFVYTPYEGKTGKDSFSYVAIDSAGNTSPEAKVTLRIEKPNTTVTYADMEGHPAHKASIRLAEEGIYVGSYYGGSYFFQPDQAVSRGEFLSLAMAVSGLEPLEGVTLTGFYDDQAIPTWCKGYVSSALKAGVVRGSTNELGQPVFGADSTITMGEAAVMLNSLLNVSDVSVETFGSGETGHWASQAAANLATAGIIRSAEATTQTMSTQMTRGEVAQLLDGALDVMENREDNGLFSF